MRNFVPMVAVLGLLALPATATRAQEAPGDWKQTVFVYGMGVAIDGTAQMGPLQLPMDLSMSDVLDALKFGGMVAYRVENEDWSVTGDVTYMNLGWSPSGPRGKVRGQLDMDQLTLMATVGRRLTPNLEALASVAYFDLATDLEVRVLNQRTRASRDADWIDPMLGVALAVPFAGTWTYSFRYDFGGFGVGSELTTQLLTTVRHQNSEKFSWYLGYRALSYDYEDGRGADYQRYHLTQQGPLAGVSFSF
jgi:hypothetical protein